MTFMGAFEARKDQWSLLADVIYLNVGANNSGKVPVQVAPDSNVDVKVNASVKTKGWVLDLIGGYTLWQTPEASLDLLAGARYLDLQLDFGLGLGVEPYAPARAFSSSGSVWDGVIGIKGHVDLNPKWYVPYYLDVGTGQSDLTWQAAAGLAYRFNWGTSRCNTATSAGSSDRAARSTTSTSAGRSWRPSSCSEPGAS